MLPKGPYTVGKFVTEFLIVSWLDKSPLLDSRGRALGSNVSEILHVQKSLSFVLYLKYSLTEDHVALLSSSIVGFREILFAWFTKGFFICVLNLMTSLKCYLSETEILGVR